MNGFIRALLFWSVIVLLIGCGKPLSEEIVGTWNCPNGTMKFEANGTYTQTGSILTAAEGVGSYTIEDKLIKITTASCSGPCVTLDTSSGFTGKSMTIDTQTCTKQ